MRTLRRTEFGNVVALFLAFFGSTGAVSISAQVPMLSPDPIACMPVDGHSVVYADIDPVPADSDEVRVFFRRDGYGDYYYVIMELVDRQRADPVSGCGARSRTRQSRLPNLPRSRWGERGPPVAVRDRQCSDYR